ncbi:MAG: NAD(+)/NADH kinase [Selenomonas sp.]|uniref:NAD(+)/NADH kinase n=1 Tax=Selenomonas sp. TaxID=2053611 RepID=UPI0025CD608B|nr:NAD(+)/NADH kinase [Selenomonas sp.]MCI6232963.1 NAD(+)/NADH kinase [Selenomonas sp.]
MSKTMQIAIYPNLDKSDVRSVVARIIRFFSDKDVHLMLPKKEAIALNLSKFATDEIEKQPADMALSLGGDGTLLGVCQRYGANIVPLCGVNLGTVGFMADIEPSELEDCLAKILSGNYYIENRLLLAAWLRRCGKDIFLSHAINDVVVTKGGVARMLHLGLSINETHLVDYKADGLIVSTPTGSTAYSLSAGGPIMNPAIQALLVTPICAHTFSIRPLVVRDSDAVHVHIASVHQDILVTFDGQESVPLLPGDEVIVRKAKESAKIVKFEDKDYYKELLTKLWN